MPRSLEFRTAAIGDLHRQLAYAPEEARLRQMHAAEALLEEIGLSLGVDDGGGSAHPLHTVIWRITGYRPDRSVGADELLVGEALCADLAVLIQRLSETLTLKDDDRAGGAETIDAVADRLGVTVRTVQRWRRLGLALHWIRFDDGEPTLGCYRACIDAFQRRTLTAPSARRGRKDLDAERRVAIVEDARREAATSGKGVSVVAESIAPRHDRSPDAVRRLLVRHDRDAAEPIFAPRGPEPTRLRRIVERAWRWGIPASRIARHCGRSEPAIHRQLMLARRDRLLALPLEWVELPTFGIDEAESIILNAPAAREDLGRLLPGSDAHATLAAIRARTSVDDDRQEARLAASGLLRRRAAGAMAALRLERVPSAASLDAVETDLRWALQLLLTSVADELPRAIRRGEGSAGRPAERLSGESLRRLIQIAIAVAAETLIRLDPTRRQRPSRRIVLEMDKAIARSGWEERRGRAIAVVPASAAMEMDPCSDLWPWQSAIDLPPRWPQRESTLTPPRRAALRLRHGLDGTAPMSVEAIARQIDIRPAHAARLVHEAESALRCPRPDDAA